MFGFKKHGTNILHYTFEYSKDGSYGASHSNFDEMLKLSKIDYNSFLTVLDHYPSSLIYNHSTVWIKDEKEAKQLVEELNTLITIMGTRKIYIKDGKNL